MDLQHLYNLARLAQKDGNLAEAARLYRQIVAASPIPEVLVNWAMCWHSKATARKPWLNTIRL